MPDVTRCPWVPLDKDFYVRYHDEVWGVPVHDDRTHFEFLILEGAQAGLSWEIVLKRREGYRQAFANFDPQLVAQFNEAKMAELKESADIIKNRLKIAAAVKNAKVFLEIQKELGSFDAYVWQFVNGKTISHHPRTLAEYPTTSPEAEKLSKDLQKRGMSFVGPTIMYSYMQACGLVNDHSVECFLHKPMP